MLNEGPTTLGELAPIHSPIGKPLHLLGLALGGSFLLVADPILLSAFNTDSRFVAFMLLNSSVIGLSTHLSCFLNEPKYNLWLKIEPLLYSQKIIVVMVSPGLLMGNLPLASLGLGAAIYTKHNFQNIKNLEEDAKLLFNYIKEHLTLKTLATIYDEGKSLASQNKGRSISLLCGASAGLVLYYFLAPALDPITANINLGSYLLLTFPGSFITNHITGGYLIEALLHSAALGYNAYTMAFPIVGLSAAGAFLSFHTWEKLRDTTLLATQKSVEKYHLCRDFTQTKLAKVKPFWQKCQQLLFSLPSLFFTKEPIAPPTSTPLPVSEIAIGLEQTDFLEKSMLLMFRHQTREWEDYPGIELPNTVTMAIPKLAVAQNK